MKLKLKKTPIMKKTLMQAFATNAYGLIGLVIVDVLGSYIHIPKLQECRFLIIGALIFLNGFCLIDVNKRGVSK